MSYKFIFSLLLLTSFQQTLPSQENNTDECTPKDLCETTLICAAGSAATYCFLPSVGLCGLHPYAPLIAPVLGIGTATMMCIHPYERIQERKEIEHAKHLEEIKAERQQREQQYQDKKNALLKAYGTLDGNAELEDTIYQTKATIEKTNNTLSELKAKLSDLYILKDLIAQKARKQQETENHTQQQYDIVLARQLKQESRQKGLRLRKSSIAPME